MDPTSIAGLTLAVCDGLLKIGERTAQLVYDAKSFSDDIDRIYNRIRSENIRTTMLRQLLFAPSPTYGGLTLFELFNEEEQDEIKSSLGQATHTLKGACELLEKHDRSREEDFVTTKSMTTLSLKSSRSDSTRSPSPSWLSLPKTSILMLRWSLQDKKRLEKSLRDFSDLKGDIHEYIKLLSLGSDLGINTAQHLRRLQEDESSIELGFNTAASLQLTARTVPAAGRSFELEQSWTESLRAAVPIEDRFALVKHGGANYLRDRRHCTFDAQGNVDPRTKTRVDGLAHLLNQPKELVFCIPRCIGWSHFSARQSIAFVFEIPDSVTATPVSLFQLVSAKDIQPTLEEKFRLAFALANCVAQLQLVKWVHESFRSDNILFFPRWIEGAEEQNARARIDYSKPSVLGFEFSRPEFGVNWSANLEDDCFERNVYRHPERQGRPEMSFSKIHDVYALGVVLLEIGLWKQAITLQKDRFQYSRSPEVIRDQLVKHATRKLPGKMGSKYQEVVLKCLTADFGVRNDTKEDLKLQQAFRTQVVDVLAKTANSV